MFHTQQPTSVERKRLGYYTDGTIK